MGRSNHSVMLVIAVLAVSPPVAGDPAHELDQEFDNLASPNGVGEPLQGLKAPRVVITDNVIIAPASLEEVRGGWGHHGYGTSAGVVGLAAPLHVVWAKDSVDGSAATLTEWKKFSTGPTTVEVIDGDHDSIVRDPAIRLTARALKDRLRSSRDPS
jgi:thioesterase domain-containing protein